MNSGSEIERVAIEFFKKNTGTVEIFFTGRLVRVFFPISPTCRNLSKISRTQLMSSVSRNSPNDKINGLIASSQIFFTEMHHMSYLQKLPFHFTATRLDFFRDFSTIVALLINLILIFVLRRDIEGNTSYIYKENLGIINANLLIRVLGLI